MPRDFDDVYFYRAFCDLYGTVHTLALCRRNGKPALCFCPNPESEAASDAARSQRMDDLFENLTEIERLTWERILDGRSISQIADDEGVSRAAIYERIRGNSKGQGGMINKHSLIRLWWALKRESSDD